MKSRNPICTIVIANEVIATISGLEDIVNDYLYETFGVYTEKYFFSPKYQLGTWDGKIRFYTKSGKTYVNLLPDIVPLIIKYGYEIKIIDKRNNNLSCVPPPISETFFADNGVLHPITNKPWIMRPYQVELVNALISNGGGIGVAGTGAGKTSMTAAIAKSYEIAGNLRSIIIVPDKNLTEQTYKNYAQFKLDVGTYYGDNKDYHNQHIVSTWQSLQHNPQYLKRFQVVIVDECHGIRGNVIKKLLNDYNPDIMYRFGVTGTIPKGESDKMSLKITVGDVLYTIPAHELIAMNYLARLDIQIIQLSNDIRDEYKKYKIDAERNNTEIYSYTKFKNAFFPDWNAEKRYIKSEPKRLNWIANHISSRTKNTFCLVEGIAFGKRLAKLIPNSVFLHGKDDTEVRQQIYDKFEDNDDVIVIATVNIASTGLDIPRIFHLYLIDIGKSYIRVIQSLGRGLRMAEDKDSIQAYDICSDFKYSKRHLTDRIKIYKEAKYPHTKTKIKI